METRPLIAVLLVLLLEVLQPGSAQNATNGSSPAAGPPPRPPSSFEKPPRNIWVTPYESWNQQRPYRPELADWLIGGCWGTSCAGPPASEDNAAREREYAPFDGWYNNLARPDQGAIDRPLLRRWPAAYRDGSYQPSGEHRPNPLELSEQLLAGPAGSQSRTGKNALLVFFGQQVVEEVLDAQRAACPPEYFNIPIPATHRYRTTAPKHTEMPLLRTRYDASTGFSPNNPRQQLNEITPYLDGGLVYGTTRAWADLLRTQSDGKLAPDGLLASSHDGRFPEYNTARLPMANPPPPALHPEIVRRHESLPVNRFFRLGNPRGNENPFLLTFGVVWFRWHNYLARAIRRRQPRWSGDRVFAEARRWVIATQQHLVLHVWLPEWLGEHLPPYRGYDPSVESQIDQFFQAAAMRFGHTLVPPGVYLRDYGRRDCSPRLSEWGRNSVRTCNSFWRPQDSLLTRLAPSSGSSTAGDLVDVDRVLMGMALQRCEEEDHRIVEDLRGNVFGPLEFSRRDLMAVNIQRARDHGLPGFNAARAAYGLPRVTNASDHFTRVQPEILERLRTLYTESLAASRINVSNVDDGGWLDHVDIWVGGILETTDGPGELFRTVIADQFRRIRDGDRFWYENGQFTAAEVDRINGLRVYDLLMAVTRMDSDDVPSNPFGVARGTGDLPRSCVPRVQTSNCGRLNESATYPCMHLPALDARALNENCTDPGTYDYFSGSEWSYALTWVALGLTLLGGGLYVFISARREGLRNSERAARNREDMRNSVRKTHGEDMTPHPAKEWMGRRTTSVDVALVLNTPQRRIEVMTRRGGLSRALDLAAPGARLEVITASDRQHMLLRTDHQHDLVVCFDTDYFRDGFARALERFTEEGGISRERISMPLKAMLGQAITRDHRRRQLDSFFRVVFAQALNIRGATSKELRDVDSRAARSALNTEITLAEFADALAMRPDADFVRRFFKLADRDGSGFVSFREFLDVICVFARGTARDRARLLFDMYDINGTGYLSEQDFREMVLSLMGTVHANEERRADVEAVLAGVTRTNAERGISFDGFFELFKDDIELVGNVNLEFAGAAKPTNHLTEALDGLYEDPADLRARVAGQPIAPKTIADSAKRHIDEEQFRDMGPEPRHLDNPEADTIIGKARGHSSTPGGIPRNIPAMEFEKPPSMMAEMWHALRRSLQARGLTLFWATLYTLVLIAVFAERAYYYSVEREHSGLRRIAGYGVTVTRGAASAMMFTYATLLLTMCRNLASVLRDTAIGRYIPFDAAVDMHKYVACWALAFTVLHVVGHAFNFYHISTQTSEDLTCLFRNYFRATHELPKFHYWCWGTITGFSGVLLTLVLGAIYICAIPGAPRRLFWLAHSMYPVAYALMVIHGCGRLIQAPFIGNFLAGPLALYVLDSLVSAGRRSTQLRVIRAELLPSGVTCLEFKRPTGFQYKSGQWIRLACSAIAPAEYHPFTLSSGPHEANLTVHIRAVGPWTHALRSVYDVGDASTAVLPRLHLDGPYGEGHQDWDRYDVSVLVGGGIGVTPFASILKDIVYRSNRGGNEVPTHKVYFIWVTRTQHQFEWLVDLLRELEAADVACAVSVHLFVTQYYHKFDLRTTLLYLCERHFQRVSGRSLLTGLRAVTHFGRPRFEQFLRSVQSLHGEARSAGVFSCGPPSLTSAVEDACTLVNRQTHGTTVTYQHHFKNY